MIGEKLLLSIFILKDFYNNKISLLLFKEQNLPNIQGAQLVRICSIYWLVLQLEINICS